MSKALINAVTSNLFLYFAYTDSVPFTDTKTFGMSKKQEQSSKNQFSIVPRIFHKTAYLILAKVQEVCNLSPICQTICVQKFQPFTALKRMFKTGEM